MLKKIIVQYLPDETSTERYRVVGLINLLPLTGWGITLGLRITEARLRELHQTFLAPGNDGHEIEIRL